MKRQAVGSLRRRGFLASLASAAAAGAVACRPARGAMRAAAPRLEAGEGGVDITPPLGIELAGFRRRPGDERLIRGIRQPAAARALVLRLGDAEAAIVSLDMLYVSRKMAVRVRREVEKQTGIPAGNVRVCATHSHSMPSFQFLRQWGAVPDPYQAATERKIVEAVGQAKADAAPAELLLGKSRATGANHNRTTKDFKTDEQFNRDSTDAQRWLDTTVHVLRFQRGAGKRDLLWYHFSAHPVCFADHLAGPDWPGMIAEKLRDEEKLNPSFLQGHIGDVNPGDGDPWRGDADKTVRGLYPAIQRALAGAATVKVDALRTAETDLAAPLDLERFKEWLTQYEKEPAQCKGGHWVDEVFAADWFEGARRRDFRQTHLSMPLSALRLGEVGFLFHPAELYSYYGLAIRRDSPLPTTLVVGYTDDAVGYLADPQAYRAGEYAALVVPKILDLPPFTPEAAGEIAAASVELLGKLDA